VSSPTCPETDQIIAALETPADPEGTAAADAR